jgi:hypothetical protein
VIFPLTTLPPHVDGVLNTCKTLRDFHIPFGVITRKNLAELSKYRLVILPNLLMVSVEEVAAIRDFVRQGGKIYASKYTSLLTVDGNRKDNFLLGDVFGISYLGETQENDTFMAPVDEFKETLAPYTRLHPTGFNDSQLIVRADTAKVMAAVSLPYTIPQNYALFSSLHNNPPGFNTEFPSLVLNRYGKGQAMYAATAFERYEPIGEIFVRLLEMLSCSPFSFQVEATKTVEVTLFKQTSQGGYLVNFLNFQGELPNLPVRDILVRIKGQNNLNGVDVTLVPSNEAIHFKANGDTLEFTLPLLETFPMVKIDLNKN